MQVVIWQCLFWNYSWSHADIPSWNPESMVIFQIFWIFSRFKYQNDENSLQMYFWTFAQALLYRLENLCSHYF